MSAPTVVVLRALKLGDLLVAVPALRAVRRHWPRHRVVLATTGWLAPLVTMIDAVDELLPTDGLAWLPPVPDRPDVAVNLHGCGPRSNRVLDRLRPARRIGHRGHGWPGPRWRDDLHERDRWCRLLRAHGVPADPTDLALPVPVTAETGTVLVHPGAAYGSKRWPAERFAEVAAELAAAGHRVAITGTEPERPLADEVARRAGLPPDAVLAGRTGLVELAATVAGARLLVSGDTGIAHLGYAYRTPSVVLFGPAAARHWGPPAGGPHVVLSRTELRRGEPFVDEPDPALLGVSPAEVLDAAFTLLTTTDAVGAGS